MALNTTTNHSRPATPLSYQQPITVTPLMNFESPVSLMNEEQPFSTSLADTLQLPSSSDGPLLPLLTSPHKSKPLQRFSLSDLLDGAGGRETLGPEIAVADINIASEFFFTVFKRPIVSKRPILIFNQTMAVSLNPPLVRLFTSLREDMTNLLELALPFVLRMLSLLMLVSMERTCFV